MTLRIMLLGLVASMGLELPSGPEVSGWTRSGLDWAHARMADLSGPAVEACWPDAGPADCHQADVIVSVARSVVAEERKVPADVAFVVASEAMAADFAADLMAMRDGRSPEVDVPAMLACVTPPAGLSDGEELLLQDPPAGDDDPVDVVVSDDVTVEVADGTDDSPARADRVSCAVQLTREAVRAWAELMRESPDDAGPSR